MYLIILLYTLKKEISVSKDTLIKSQKFYLEVFLNTQVRRH